MNKTIRIGTRGSKLALWQAEHVASLISPSGYRTEIIPIETSGDRILDVSISKIGSKGVFTEELENKLMDGSIDIAVHSAKDLSSELPEDLEIIAFSKREPVNDVIISFDKNFAISNPGVVIGTSATRRVAFIKHFYSQAQVVSIRGNLQTRIQKMKDGNCDALMLAYAGVHRMGYENMIVEKIETSYFVPPVGQGSIAVECHQKLSFDKKEIIEQWVNDVETEDCIRTERAFLKEMHGGCSVPVFGYAHFENGLISLKGGIISLDGQQVVKKKRLGNSNDFRELGRAVAIDVLESGGKEILEEIKQHIKIA